MPESWKKRSVRVSKGWKRVVGYANSGKNQRRDVGKRQRAIVFDDDDDDEPVREEEIHRKRIEEYDREFELENGRKRGKNEVPDVDSWFKRKLGNMFNEDMNRDSQM